MASNESETALKPGADEVQPIPVTVLRQAVDADKAYLAWLEEACMRDYAVALWGVCRAVTNQATGAPAIC